MYLDEKNEWSPPERPPGPDPKKRREGVIMALVGVNILLLFVAPIGGFTLFQGVWRFVLSFLE